MYRTPWLRKFRRENEDARVRLDLRIALFEEGFSLILFGLHFPLYFLQRFAYDPHEVMEAWGVCHFERSIHFNWGRHTKIVHLPWDYVHIKHEVRRPDGSWVPYVADYDTGPLRVVNARGATFGGKDPDGRWQETYPYRYVLRDGTIQDRQATVYVERREWRQKWLKWCPLFAKRRQSIDIAFNDEVGERTGSWKGGTVGCGWDLLPNETPLESLRRMERERTF